MATIVTIAVELKILTELWNDAGLGNYNLYFIRSKDGKETDFLITKNKIDLVLVRLVIVSVKGICNISLILSIFGIYSNLVKLKWSLNQNSKIAKRKYIVKIEDEGE